MSSYSDNDDDLFEEQPSISAASSFHDLFAHSEHTTSDQAVNSLIEETKGRLSSKNLDSDQFRIRTGIVTSFYEVCNRFAFANDSLLRTEYDYLNQISDNLFGKLFYLNFLEENIIKRFSVQHFLTVIINTDDVSTFEEAAKTLNIQIDTSFIRVYFGAILKLMDHAIDRSIAIYEKLCSELNKVPLKAILDKDHNSPDLDLISSSSYIMRSFDSIKTSLGF